MRPSACYGRKTVATVLAILTDAFGGFGGISQYNRDFLRALAEDERIERVIVLPRIADLAVPSLPNKVEQLSESVGSLGRFAKTCIRTTRSVKPDIVLCGHVNLLPFAAPIAKHHHCPLVLMMYGIEVWQPPRLASRVLLNRVNHTVSISRITYEKAAAWSSALARAPVSLIPNAVDLQQYVPNVDKPKYLLDRYQLNGRKVIMTLARLVDRERYKGVDEMLEVLPALLEKEPSLCYLVVGSGSDLPRLRAKASTLGLNDRVVFSGRVSDAERIDHYHLADAFVMPGRGEGFGFVFIEAMACGIPVVASVLDGSREAVRFGSLGQLCDPRDQASIISATHRALAASRTAAPPGLEYFSMENFNARVRCLVEQVSRG